MTQQFRARFTDSHGEIFLVDAVCETPQGLTVKYTKAATGETYSCLLEAFTERYREITNDG